MYACILEEGIVEIYGIMSQIEVHCCQEQESQQVWEEEMLTAA